MNIPDIGKYKWIKEDSWPWKWYDNELCLLVFGPGVNPLARYFTETGINTAILNIIWFWEKKTSDLWDLEKENALVTNKTLFSELVKESKRYINEVVTIISNVEKTKTVDLILLKEIKKGLVFLWYIFLVDFGTQVGNTIDKRLKNKGLNKNQIEQIKEYYFNNYKPLAHQKEKEDLAKIASFYKAKYGENIFNLGKLPSDVEKMIINHQVKYCWLENDSLDAEPTSVDKYYKNLVEILNGNDIKQIIQKKKSQDPKKFIGREDQIFLSYFNQHLYIDNLSADLYAKLDFLMERLISQKFNVSFKDLTWYSFTDLEELVINNKKLTPNELLLRKKYRLMFEIQGKVKTLYGKENYMKAKKILVQSKKIPNLKEITGMVACRGKVAAVVRIINSEKDIKKVNKGDILVAVTTRPQLMVAIRKAAAIITDTGGITSHAAIVARELNIPCIVGTKIATQVLKDGDLVEVDANNGIVRKLNK